MPTSLFVDLHAVLISLGLVTPRVMVCLMVLPGFGVKVLTGMGARCAALAISLPAAVPTFYYVQSTPPDLVLGMMLAVKEAFIGLMLGALLSTPFWVTQSIAAIFDNQRMAIQMPMSNPAIDQDAGPLAGMLIQAVTVAMMQAGLFVALTRILIESFAPWPAHLLAPPFDPGHFDIVIRRFGDLFWHIIVYGSPIIIPLLLVEFCFAMIGVFAPNLQVTFAASPIKSLGGLLIVLVYWSTFSHHVTEDFAGLLQLIPSLLDASPK